MGQDCELCPDDAFPPKITNINCMLLIRNLGPNNILKMMSERDASLHSSFDWLHEVIILSLVISPKVNKIYFSSRLLQLQLSWPYYWEKTTQSRPTTAFYYYYRVCPIVVSSVAYWNDCNKTIDCKSARYSLWNTRRKLRVFYHFWTWKGFGLGLG